MKIYLATLVISALGVPHAALAADAVPTDFLRNYCIGCHGPEKQKGDRRFDRLALPARNVEDAIDLQDIVDQLNLGDMPPKKSKQPPAAERAGIIAALTGAVTAARAKFQSTGGQTVLRRLNKREYINTVGDLFALDMRLFDPTTKFPARSDGRITWIIWAMCSRPQAICWHSISMRRKQVVEKALSVTDKPQEQARGSFEGQLPAAAGAHRIRMDGCISNKYLCIYEVTDTENHEGGYGFILEFPKRSAGGRSFTRSG